VTPVSPGRRVQLVLRVRTVPRGKEEQLERLAYQEFREKMGFQDLRVNFQY